MTSNADNAMARFLFAILKQKNLKDIAWDDVANDPVLLQPIASGKAARMRFCRFRSTITGYKPTTRIRAGEESEVSKPTSGWDSHTSETESLKLNRAANSMASRDDWLGIILGHKVDNSSDGAKTTHDADVEPVSTSNDSLSAFRAAAAPSPPDEGYDQQQDDASSTTSIDWDEFKVKYQLEKYGRTYCCSKKKVILHPYPDDKQERVRQEMLHNLCKEILKGKNFRSPIDKHPQSIVDASAGTEFWGAAIEEFPGAKVHGFDVRSMQGNFVPPNLEITVVRDDDPYFGGYNLDFLFARDAEYEKIVIDEGLQHLRPGGWVELHRLFLEPRGEVKEGSKIVQWAEYMNAARKARGNSFDSALSVKERMIAKGYMDVNIEWHEVPLNTLSEDPHLQVLGNYGKRVVADELWTLSKVSFRDGLGWSATKLRELLFQVRDEMLKSYVSISLAVVYGRRPLVRSKRHHDEIS